MNDDRSEGTSKLADAVAQTALDLHKRIAPPGGSLAHNGAIEWTCLACVCLVIEGGTEPQIVPISLATGTKTLPYCDIKRGHGDVVHDSHAEVLARRGARRWIAERMLGERGVCGDEHEVDGMPMVFEKADEESEKWKMRSNVRVWWYVSTLPCGQCSMPYAMRKRSQEDEVIGAKFGGPGRGESSQSSAVTRGRNFTDDSTTTEIQRPTLRTVPGRADSPPSLSHSCSDKLLLWSLIGWQGSVLSRYIDRLPIDGLVISKPEPTECASQLKSELHRGLDISLHLRSDGSLAQLATDMKVPQAQLNSPEFYITTHTFPQSQHAIQQKALASGIPAHELREKVSPAWGATNWFRPLVDSRPTQAKRKEVELLVNGIRRGAPFKRGKDLPLSDKTRSRLCKLEWFRFMRAFEEAISGASKREPATYAQWKGKGVSDEEISLYRRRKGVLRGGALSAEKQEKGVQSWLGSLPYKDKKRKQLEAIEDVPPNTNTANAAPTDGTRYPLHGWLTTPSSIESFNVDGIRATPDHQPS